MVQNDSRSRRSIVVLLRRGLCFGARGEETDSEGMEPHRPDVLDNPRRHKRRHSSSRPPREEIRSAEPSLIAKNLLVLKLRRHNTLRRLRDTPFPLRRFRRRRRGLVLVLPANRLSPHRFR